MAKRFIDTDVFKKQFVRDLKPAYKLLWFYITTDCNHAGIWECDFNVAQMRTGQKIDSKTAIKLFKDKIVELDGGSKWFIPSFIEFQYGQLSEKNRAHINVISILKKFDLIDENNLLKPLHKDLTSPLQGAKEKDKDKEKEKVTEQEPEKEKGGTGERFLVPQMQQVFKKHITTYLPDQNRDFEPLYSIATFLCQQAKARGMPEENIDQVLDVWEHVSASIAKDQFYSQKSLKTISTHIQELTQKALHGDKSVTKNSSSKLDPEKAKAKLSERFAKTG